MQLLKSGVGYYHPALRQPIGTPKVVYSDRIGEVMIRQDPQVSDLALRASFTLADLTDYYAKKTLTYYQHVLEKPEQTRVEGSFKWLMNHYTLDEILFMIDACFDERAAYEQRRPRSPLEIQDYLDDGRERLVRTQNILTEAGFGPAMR